MTATDGLTAFANSSDVDKGLVLRAEYPVLLS
jgi:hypothetical protein